MDIQKSIVNRNRYLKEINMGITEKIEIERTDRKSKGKGWARKQGYSHGIDRMNRFTNSN